MKHVKNDKGKLVKANICLFVIVILVVFIYASRYGEKPSTMIFRCENQNQFSVFLVHFY